jgi:hypothetical protein
VPTPISVEIPASALSVEAVTDPGALRPFSPLEDAPVLGQEPIPAKPVGREEQIGGETPPQTPGEGAEDEAPADEDPATSEPEPQPEPAQQGAPGFAPDSVWTAPIAEQAVDPQSPLIVGALDAVVEEELSRKVGPWITSTGFSTPIYTVSADQPTVRVLLQNNNAALQQAFAAVPLPPDARPASGTDGQLTVWQPSTDRLWEFWRMSEASGEWRAQWGGAIEHVSQSAGYFSSESWPGARSNWGATATSLPLVGGLITLADLQRGEIDHALALGYPLTKAGVFRFPAQRTDGKSNSINALAEGTRLRIDPGLDLASLHLPPLTLMLAQAAQRYGIVLRDTSGVVDFFAQDPTPTGTNAYAPWLEGKKPWQLLAQFPWRELQALSAPECTAQPCPPSTSDG